MLSTSRVSSFLISSEWFSQIKSLLVSGGRQPPTAAGATQPVVNYWQTIANQVYSITIE
jgi:hypothetical protein